MVRSSPPCPYRSSPGDGSLHIRCSMYGRLICAQNTHNNPKKRRLSGREDAPVVFAQDSSSASAVYSPPVCFTEHELQILGHAASVLNCPVSQLLDLDRQPRRQLAAPPIAYHAPKRLRMSTDTPSMSTKEKPSLGLSRQERPERLPRDHSEDGGSSGYRGSKLASYFASVSFHPPCTTCEPEGYSGVPATSSYDYGPKAASPRQPWNLSPDKAGVFAYDDSPKFQFTPDYHSLQHTQPMAVQPSTRGEEMAYQITSPENKYSSHSETQRDGRTGNHVTNARDLVYRHPAYVSPGSAVGRYSTGVGFLPVDGDISQMSHQPAGLDILSNNNRPPPAKRGPFKSNAEREKTAETRRMGSCIRCRMQRIRCEINPDDKMGTCLTCARVSSVKIWRLPCLRYKITDVKLFKPGQVKGYEWTRRWAEGIADDISHWASLETRNVCVTEGYTPRPVQLRVRQFVPQEGDALERTWMHEGTRRSVTIPPFAIVNIEEAKTTYTDHINEGVKDCCRHVLTGKDKLIWATYALALSLSLEESTDPKEKDLLRKALRLWMAIRMTTKSTYIIGEERLGMNRDIMDETSPLRGHIPLPPVMGAQIELVLIHQLQSKWRREMLDGLQVMIQANSHTTWLTTYLVTFILLHNVSLLCQHDAGYARKHGIKARFAREDMVREYQLGANILLAYFHYCNKGIFPFSVECKVQDLSTLAKLDGKKILYVSRTRAIVEEQKMHWQKIRHSNNYEHDFYFISQLYEENWQPQPMMV
ncbi:hypothetical protein BJ170DRAFT_15910 [Xylariales sp. AK1849]|nr:hypothetical protein BJ170DRAFT_15910 [Xylariales sp. AK1849]